MLRLHLVVGRGRGGVLAVLIGVGTFVLLGGGPRLD